tara:strand:+ start:1814 stop:2662 length:849 start_codon:yes stop_codon:yes gene_type:complete
MNSLKHSKVKNTAILFELLVRQIAADTMENRNSPAIVLLKKHFREGTELYKELSLYRTLAEERFVAENQATRFLSAAVQSRKQLNETTLRRSKYNLIRDIKNKLVFENFINARISNYKLNASIYKLFEYNVTDSPAEITRCQLVITEHIITEKAVVNNPTPALELEDPVVRKLASKIVIDRFNEKYSGLNADQKELLKEYVNSVNNSPALLDKVKNQIPVIVENLNTLNSTIPSKVVKIKLQEVTNMVSGMNNIKTIQDKHILTMLRYYELIDQLKGVQNGK